MPREGSPLSRRGSFNNAQQLSAMSEAKHSGERASDTGYASGYSSAGTSDGEESFGSGTNL